MCVNYLSVPRAVAEDVFAASFVTADHWPPELYRDYLGPIIIGDERGRRRGLVASFGLVPKAKLPPGRHFDTMNARDDTVGQLRNYRPFWLRGQRCLVPMQAFFEPNWEQEQHVRWRIGMADDSPFAVAGLYRHWEEPDGSVGTSFTQLTINADDHALMRRMHRPGEEKRSLVIVPARDYDDWLSCRDPERARSFLRPYPAEAMKGEPAPKQPPRPRQPEAPLTAAQAGPAAPAQAELF